MNLVWKETVNAENTENQEIINTPDLQAVL